MNLSNIISVICLINFFLLEFVFSLTSILSSFAMFFFGLFFLLLPIVVLGHTVSNIGKTIKGRDWPHVRGRISDVELDNDIFAFLRGQRFMMVYDYYVKDKLHSNDQFNPSKAFINFKDLFHIPQLRNKSFTELEGNYVKVYFNPKNPWESMLCNKTYFEFSSLLLPSLNALIITWYIFYSVY